MPSHLLEGLAEALSPTRCAGCDMPGALLCPPCAAALPRVPRGAACPRCGAPAGEARARQPGAGCPECAGRALAFAQAWCAGTLEPPLSRAIVLHKDGGERRLGPLLGALALEALPRAPGAAADAVTWVPASRAALRRRGFDHAEAIAREVARVRGIPAGRLLVRSGCGDQRELGRDARAANAAAAFSAVGRAPARILLVDDVLTTGATCDACARALLRAGACEVRVLAVARACGGGRV